MANYGVRPTFDEAAATPVMETHLFEAPEIKAGDSIRVELISFLRDECRFETVEALKEQIAKDKQAAVQVLAG